MIPCSLSLARRLTGGLLCLIGLLPLATQATLNDGVNGNVYAVAHGADGTTYVGGAFSAAGATTGGFGALNTTDGTVNRAFPQVVGAVEVSVADGAGGWFIGGSFTQVGGLARSNLARIDSSGAVTDWAPAANSSVTALALSGSTLYVGGDFITITPPGGSPTIRTRLAAISTADTGSLTDWAPATDNLVTALAVSGSTLYVGGWYTTITPPGGIGTPRNYLAALSTVDTGTLTDWAPAANMYVRALALSGSTLYAAGFFTTITPPGGSPTTRSYLAALNTDDAGSLTDWAPAADNTVNALTLSGSTLYAGGYFTTITPPGGSPTSRTGLAAISTVDTGSLTDWAPAAAVNGVYALTLSGPTLGVGGTFTVLGTPRKNLAAFGPDGSLTDWAPAADNTVMALALSGSTLYVGGSFATVTPPGGSTTTRTRLAAISTADTGSLTDWAPAADNTVMALALSGSTLYAGGVFTAITPPAGSATARYYLAALKTDDTGSLTGWAPTADNTVMALALSGSTLYVGGDFTTITPPAGSATARSRLAALSAADTGSLADWAPAADNTVMALALSGSTLYAGGSFTTITPPGGSATARTRLAAISTAETGSLTDWAPAADNTVMALALSGSTLYAGGSFTTITPTDGSATPRYALAALSTADTGSLADWAPAAKLTNWWGGAEPSTVMALALSGSTVYAGGAFITINDAPTSGLARLDALPCSSGIPVTTARWQQLALPCVPSGASPTIAAIFGNAPAANLPAATYASQWIFYGRNGTNSGNVALAKTASLAPAAGYWFKSLTAPIDGTLTIAGTATVVETDVTGCTSANGCVVIPVATGTAAARLIGNPFPYDVDWSKVRVRVNGTVYTPGNAFNNGYLDKQIWIWNGNNTYDTWDDATEPGNLQYFKSFFIKVLPGGSGQSIELLIPAEVSTIPVTAVPTDLAERLAALVRAGSAALRDWLIPGTNAAEAGDAAGWQVRLRVENPKTGAKARALLGQKPGAALDYDPADLSAMAPFASPYLTLVLPRPGWGVSKGDYASDFRPADGAPDHWPLELRSNPAGAAVILRWEAAPEVLARSRLTDGLTGAVIDPTDPAYAAGYPLTLKTQVRRLTWEYLGD